MKICCATDFSEAAEVAARAAAAIAARVHAPLHLLHAAQLPAPGAAGRNAGGAELDRRRDSLRAAARRLRALDCEVIEELLEGAPGSVLIERARALGAELIVIGPHGERRASPWSLGSLAMRLIKGAHAPVLVVRDERSLAAWAKGERALRVLVGLDRTHTSKTALAWSRQLARVGTVELVAGHVYSAAESSQRYSLAHEADPARELERIEIAVASEMRAGLAVAADMQPRLKLLAGWGRVAHHLLDLTDSECADVLVIGTHRREGLERLWRGSVSLDLAAHAKCNVLTVPATEVESRQRTEAREIRRVLVPCDLSGTSKRAVAWAVSLLARGGTLHLLHVSVPYIALAPDFGGLMPIAPPTAEELARQTADLQRQLQALVPGDAGERNIEARFEVVNAFDPATAIVQAAERDDVDVICLTTHGRSGVSRALMGSVAESVLRHAHVPILVLTPHREAKSD